MEKHIYIVGAHSRGRTFKEYVTFLYPDTVVEAFLVDELSENEPEIDGIPVKAIRENLKLNPAYPVYMATRGIYHKKISEELRALGMQSVYPVDVALDSRLRNEYVRKVFEAKGVVFRKMEEKIPQQSVHARIYVASSVLDAPLKEVYVLRPEERIIQVGAALTEERLRDAAAFDDTGDNISLKNKQYCELTALYWIWKNAQQEIVGLVHYRRHFLLPDDWLDRMIYHEIDVILPVPLYVAPNLEDNYRQRHDPADWDFVMEYMRENNPADYEAARRFFRESLYSPCNMFIMRKHVLDQLCQWLFPILEAAEQHQGMKEDKYCNRYPGFLAERLITFYFDYHRDQYKVVYADKNFLQ